MQLFISLAAMFSVFFLLFFIFRIWNEYQSKFKQNAKISLDDLFFFIDPQQLFIINILFVIFLPLILYIVTNSLVVSLGAAILVFFLPKFIYSKLKRSRLKKLIEQMPDALNMMAGAMRAGGSLSAAMDLIVEETPPPFSQEISLVLREQKLGVTLDDALENLARRIPLQDVELLVSAITISKEVGGSLAEVLERLASTLRSKAAMEGKISALTSQGKLQGIVVGLLPVLLAAVLFHMEPEAMAPLFSTYYGWIVIAVSDVLLLLGGVMIKKIVTIDV